MIEVVHLFPKVNSLLIEVLEGLSPAQWNNSTLCKNWTVKDITAHLLDTALRRVSVGRDGHMEAPPEINSYADLVDFLNRLNADWVKACKRVSPQLLTQQMLAAQDQLYEHLLTLDMSAPALLPVSWAGEDHSLQWFDIAREYTERWHHQQQIRQATGAASILQRELYYPFLDISMQALPFHYQSKMAAGGTGVKVNIVGDAGGSWIIVKTNSGWEFTDITPGTFTNVYIDQNIAWLLFSRGIGILEAEQYWQISGDYELGFHALKMTAFMI